MIDSEHISDLQWDELIAGDLPAAAEARARAHARTCARCRDRLAALSAGARAFAAAPPAIRRSARRWLAAAGVVAVAATLVLVIRSVPSGSDTRVKGTSRPELVLAAGRPAQMAVLASGDRVSPGDSVQAAYTSDRDGFGAVLSRDGAGTTTAYVPARGDAMVALPAGALASFPQSTVLDAVPGEEILIVLWCEAAHPLAPLLAELDAHGTIAAPSGCTVKRVTVTK